MLFQTVDNLKRQSIMISIVLMAVGIVMIICPERYELTLTSVLGYVLVITATVWVLEFIASNKTLIRYIYFTLALIMDIAGMCVLFYRHDILRVLGWLFGVILILDGAYGIFNAMTYARRSGRVGWQILVILCSLLVVMGILLILNLWWDSTHKLFLAIGVMLLISSAVDACKLIWIWPQRTE